MDRGGYNSFKFCSKVEFKESKMSTRILDGKWLSGRCLEDVAGEVKALTDSGKRKPGLGVILVGDNQASATYVRNKERTAERCGFHTLDVRLPKEASFEAVKEAILDLNKRSDIDGILLQLPVPKHLDSNALLDVISPKKDADGLHPHNQGLMLRGQGVLRPCTPVGVMKLIDLAFSSCEIGTEVKASSIPAVDLGGKCAIVIGRSILVGKPLAMLLLERNATVMMAHSKSPDFAKLTSAADIVVAAVGVPRLVKAAWLKQGSVVIDVGINPEGESGKLVGDVDYNEALARCAAITPVPGGVGPMTVAMLIRNTLLAYKGAGS